MNETLGRGMRLVMRVVLLQACSAVAVSLIGWIAAGVRAGISALAGGIIAAVGTALFGWRMFAPGIAGGGVLKRAMMAGETLKWFWVVGAVWAALTVLKLPPLPLMVGLVAAQFGYWFGLVRFK